MSGTRGSGTIFFSGCSLGCDFCQNSDISHHTHGKAVDTQHLAGIMLDLFDKGAHNINLVTADHYIPHILPSLKLARERGLDISVLFNTPSYLTPETLSLLDGVADGFIADLKFFTSPPAKKYSHAPDYPDVAKAAITQMTGMLGAPVIEDGILKRGVIVRIPVLPDLLIDAKRSIKYVCDTFGDKVILSVMSQYTPMPTCAHPELSRPLTEAEYRSITRYVDAIGADGYIQQFGANGTEYIPDFNLEGV